MSGTVQPNHAHELYERIFHSVGAVIKGKDQALRKLLAAFFTGHHVLLEDVPGTGKTTTAKTLAASIKSDFQRIQFTPDLLPSDIVGVSIYNQQLQQFSFHKGPLFTAILLADEINRASPRTQSALLEAMAEKQVSVDGRRYALEDTFFVIATQNPAESHGTYPLPEAQMDRFGLQFSLGYVSAQEEVGMLGEQSVSHPLEHIHPCADKAEIAGLRTAIKATTVSEELKRYIVDIVGATRRATGVKVGASFRASLTLMQTAQALALFDAQGFVTPEHVQELAVAVLAHRLSLNPQSRFSGRDAVAIVQEILQTVPVPV
jgi:MoxR-like ATPase